MIQYYGHKGLDKFLHEKYFNNVFNGVLIEAGAYDGINMSSGKVFEDNFGWKCVNIEPHPLLFEKLVKNRSISINLNFALSDKVEECAFESPRRDKNAHVVRDDGFLPHLRTPAKPPGHRNGAYKYVVKATTFTNIVETLKLDHIDLFVLDTEGWEIPALKGMIGCNVIPDVLCVESCPSINSVVSYERFILDNFKMYRKDSTCWLNDIYIKNV